MVNGARDAPARYVGVDESSGRLADPQPAGGCLLWAAYRPADQFGYGYRYRIGNVTGLNQGSDV